MTPTSHASVRTQAYQEGVREGLKRAAQVARDRLERARNHGPNIELTQNSPGYSDYRAGAIVTAEVIMNTIRVMVVAGEAIAGTISPVGEPQPKP